MEKALRIWLFSIPRPIRIVCQISSAINHGIPGKEKNLNGDLVYQGISVYGNKGSTDQHAYVQQLREGVPNFFATFIEVLENRQGDSAEVDDDGMTSGDYLHGFMLGTRDALLEKADIPSPLQLNPSTQIRLVSSSPFMRERLGFMPIWWESMPITNPGSKLGKKLPMQF